MYSTSRNLSKHRNSNFGQNLKTLEDDSLWRVVNELMNDRNDEFPGVLWVSTKSTIVRITAAKRCKLKSIAQSYIGLESIWDDAFVEDGHPLKST